ncbi:Putative six-hairpin glycosidase superfamily [Colletotrichum destructivum]|uniref:Six-hairpin glycosidase superfamily n=1 Tax=Colletotrichum destructivum TaxID=34406 RepID=A0AAX4IDR3_9PEZI|nr:Putative six-hairpin glycosidase superfamily [Colletotrichum destructivum]
MRVLHLLPLLWCLVEARIDRKKIVQIFNPRRNASSPTTPLQVGNGNFAFGADITGLQTFSPFATMSTWGWHNFSLPTTPGQTSIEDYHGTEWWTHGRLVQYNMANPSNNDIANWLRENPHRINLCNIGFLFEDGQKGKVTVTEGMLDQRDQILDMWTGVVRSSFTYNNITVKVETWVDPASDTVAVSVDSKLLSSGELSIFFDFPYPTNDKFGAPFVGAFNQTDKHKTFLSTCGDGENRANIHHDLSTAAYDLGLEWDVAGGKGTVKAPTNGSHRHVLSIRSTDTLRFTATFATSKPARQPTFEDVVAASREWWPDYWSKGAFIDMTGAADPRATELHRRTVQSQYLAAVNSASDYPPQESGLVNNGWFGKFHMEMTLWHTLQFARWNHHDLLARSLPQTYTRLLPSSLVRASTQGYTGARWGKMTDPSATDAPGEINTLLIWQQPHTMYFAELEYRHKPSQETLTRWEEVLTATADFMSSYAFRNETTGFYDLGPPMYPVSENTSPNATVNPTFELAYWRFGLDVAIAWKLRLGKPAPKSWITVRDNLAPLPVVNATYPVYEGIPDMWTSMKTVQDHPAMAGIFGLLPPPASGPPLNRTVLENTAARIWELWDLDESFGWDFPMLAMNSLRLGDSQRAVEYLLHPTFQFDDAGYPVGGARVPTPYFPSSSSLLLAMAMMAGGWDGGEGPHFPEGWDVVVEGFAPGL